MNIITSSGIRLAFASLALAILTGCGSVHKIGTVGNQTFYSVSNARLFAPNYNALVVSNSVTETVSVQQVIGGSAISGAVISSAVQGGAIVGGAYLLGHNFPKNVGDNVSASGGDTTVSANGGTGSSTATGGNRTNGNSANAPGHNKP